MTPGRAPTGKGKKSPAVGWALAALLLLAPSLARAAPPITYGAWTLQCETAVNTAKEYCRLTQSTFFDANQTERLLQVVIARSGNSKNLGLLLWLPLGISLPMGTFLQSADNEPLELVVERCERNGCRVEVELDSAYLDLLQQADEARVLVHDRSRELAELPFSLIGLTEGLQALRQRLGNPSN
tara:strand:+ start:1989 stop:2540 length:552 start_codon:yes stop_codon:yes gene_type:complete